MIANRPYAPGLPGFFALFGGCCLSMLAVMRWNVRHALRPLQSLVDAIAGIERRDMVGIQSLSTMPVRELETIAVALKQAAAALECAEDERRVLTQKMLTLQEDERQRLAHDLHDEFGQRLTALRVDAAWLRKRIAGDGTAEGVVAGMSGQIARIQADVRDTLARLQPLAPDDAGATDRGAARLREMLGELAAGWKRSHAGGLSCIVSMAVQKSGAADVLLPHALVLAVYRISQEAFTNAARHGGARCACVCVDVLVDAAGAGVLHWRAADDGIGLLDPEHALRRGNGLAGIKERVWALGGELEWSASNPPPMRGLELRASLRFDGGRMAGLEPCAQELAA